MLVHAAHPPRSRAGIVLVLLAVILVNWFLAELVPAVVTRSRTCTGFDTWEFASRGLNMRKLRLIGGLR